jgi:DNA topoisomerase-1
MKYNNLVIVESPAKANTIKKYLNSIEELKKYGDFHVIASYGHIRDLEKKNKGIDIKNDFKPNYKLIINEYSTKTIKNLKENIKNSKNIWLASDLDREGEAIAWHIKEHFNLKNYNRIVFNEITKEALKNAILNPRKIDMNLVDAQQARRFIDRIVGFDITPMLWKQFNTSTTLSAGRVQSAALNIIINKEKDIKKFKTESYYTSFGDFKIDKYDINDAKYKVNDTIFKFNKKEKALSFLKKLKSTYSLSDIKTSNKSNKPPPPFITSSLQQTASGQLRQNIKQVMALAQALYESGHITYMRTDSYNLSNNILSDIKSFIINNYGNNYVNIKNHTKKSKNSQEAHEAIRPTKITLKPDDLKLGGKIKKEHQKLYELIWKRTLASQMTPSKYYEINMCITNSVFNKNECFLGMYKIFYFDGYLKLYGEKVSSNFNLEKYITDISNLKNSLKMITIHAKNTWSIPPPRFSESTIVKVLEKEGVGRPSTYSSILSKLYDKRYIEKKDVLGEVKEYINYTLFPNDSIKDFKVKKNLTDEKSKLVPSDIGNQINNFMLKNFKSIIDVNFTSDIENNFDKIAEGNKNLLNTMKTFYKNFAILTKAVNIDKKSKIKLESYSTNININKIDYIIRIAKYGPVIQYSENIDNKENKKYISLVPYLKETNKEIEDINKKDIKLITSLPLNIGKIKGNDVILKYARYGFYLSMGNKNGSVYKNHIPLVLNNNYDEIIDLIKKDSIKFK